MPTYSYQCRDCGTAFDVQQSFTDDSLTVCPQCEGSLRKLFDSVGVVFKGSGFYRTDSRDSGASDSSGSGSGSGEKQTDGGSTPSSKPSATPSSKPSSKPSSSTSSS